MSITFQEINAQILPLFKSVIQQWLPGGHFSGEEYTVRNPLRTDDRPGSFKINATTGYWSDFATGDKGGDLVSLYAYINNTNQGKAVADLSRFFGVQDTTAKKKGKRIYTELLWPCPADTPPPPTEVPVLIDEKWVRFPAKFTWEYRNQTGQLFGYVLRYEKPEGKEVVPFTLWNTADHGICWRQKSFPTPRPLFYLDRLALSPAATVIIVEGEKKAEVLQGLLESAGVQAKLCATAWAGGSKAVLKADWSVLTGRKIILWPDFDLQKYPERHVSSGQVMPHHEQPGMVAMMTIAGLLRMGVLPRSLQRCGNYQPFSKRCKEEK